MEKNSQTQTESKASSAPTSPLTGADFFEASEEPQAQTPPSRQPQQRNASQNSLILVLSDEISNLLEGNQKSAKLVEYIVKERLLKDQDPDKAWILGLVSTLQMNASTRDIYEDLKKTIMQS